MELSGLDLRRYLMACIVERRDEATVGELLEDLCVDGFTTPARPSKAVSDALRTEVRRGRVVRAGRGVYVIAHLPRTTKHRMLHHARALRAERALRCRPVVEHLHRSHAAVFHKGATTRPPHETSRRTRRGE